MIFLLLVIIASTGIIIMFRMFPRFNVDTDQAITINYITAALIGLLADSTHTPVSQLTHSSWFLFSVLVGVILIIGFYLFALSAQKAGVAVTAISSRMSVVIPVAAGFLLFGDVATSTKLAGIMLALVAFYFTSKTEKAEKADKRYLYLPLLLFVAVGVNDTSIKMAQAKFITNDYFEFVYTSFFFAFLVGVILLFFKKKARKITFNTVIGGVLIGAINFCSIFFLVRGLTTMPVSTFMPVYNVSVVAVSSLWGFAVFKERLSALNWAGIVLAILSIILIAM